MQYIIRYKDQYWTIPADALRLRFKELLRRRASIGGIRVLEGTGRFDKSIVEIRARASEGARDAKGTQAPINHLQIKLLDRHRAIRVVDPASVETLALHDRIIEQKKRELASAKKVRAEAIKEVWRKGQKVDINDLEEKANEVLDR